MIRTAIRIIWAPLRIIRITTSEGTRMPRVKPNHPGPLPDHPDDGRIIRTPIRIIRPLPTCMTWAEARVPLLPSLTPSLLSLGPLNLHGHLI